MPVPTPAGTLLCGVTISYAGNTIGMVTRITNLGASRKIMPNIHNSLPSNWITTLVSCLAGLKPFSVGIVFNTNDLGWIQQMQDINKLVSIGWPVEVGYSTGGVLTFLGAFSDFTFGASDIEGRIEGEITISPSGPPTVTPGAHT